MKSIELIQLKQPLNQCNPVEFYFTSRNRNSYQDCKTRPRLPDQCTFANIFLPRPSSSEVEQDLSSLLAFWKKLLFVSLLHHRFQEASREFRAVRNRLEGEFTLPGAITPRRVFSKLECPFLCVWQPHVFNTPYAIEFTMSKGPTPWVTRPFGSNRAFVVLTGGSLE